MTVALADLTRASRTRRGYLPGLVQEVLLEAYGGQQLSQGVALLASAWCARSGDTAAAGPRLRSSVSFVQGSRLVTGAGWQQTVAAAREACDGEGTPATRGSRPAESSTAAPAQNFNIAADECEDHTGIEREQTDPSGRADGVLNGPSVGGRAQIGTNAATSRSLQEQPRAFNISDGAEDGIDRAYTARWWPRPGGRLAHV